MRNLYTLLLLGLLSGLSVTLAAQKDQGEVQELLAIQLEEDLAQAFREASYQQVYSIDKAGVLRPQKSYIMSYYVDQEVIEITPWKPISSISSQKDRYEELPLPGGVGKIACTCEKQADDCKFEKTDVNGPDRDDYECDGSCGCGIALIIKPDDYIPTVQTADGNWHNMPTKH